MGSFFSCLKKTKNATIRSKYKYFRPAQPIKQDDEYFQMIDTPLQSWE
jgi:hypothetical protein